MALANIAALNKAINYTGWNNLKFNKKTWDLHLESFLFSILRFDKVEKIKYTKL